MKKGGKRGSEEHLRSNGRIGEKEGNGGREGEIPVIAKNSVIGPQREGVRGG